MCVLVAGKGSCKRLSVGPLLCQVPARLCGVQGGPARLCREHGRLQPGLLLPADQGGSLCHPHVLFITCGHVILVSIHSPGSALPFAVVGRCQVQPGT